MPNITITLTDVEQKGLEYAAHTPADWASGVIKHRAKVAIDEIVDIVVKHCLDNDIQVPSTREAIVDYAFDNDLVITAKQRQADIDENGL